VTITEGGDVRTSNTRKIAEKTWWVVDEYGNSRTVNDFSGDLNDNRNREGQD